MSDSMDNSGRGPLSVPGFGDIPMNFQHPAAARFAHGFSEWRQSPMITAQEQAMVLVMDRLTDKPSWSRGVFDDETVAQWRAELDADRARTRHDSRGRSKSDVLLANPRLLGDSAWAWCVQELRDKARTFQEHGNVLVLDTGSCVCKSDSVTLGSLGTAMQRAVWQLSDAVDRRVGYYREHPGREHPGRQTKDEDYGQDEDENESAAETPVSAGHEQRTPGEGSVTSIPNVPGIPVHDEATVQSTPSAEDHDEFDDNNELSDGTPSDLGHAESDDDVYWSWEFIYGDDLLNIEGSAHMVHALVDPLMFPLAFYHTPVLQQGGAVALDNILGWYGDTEIAYHLYPVFVEDHRFTFGDGSLSMPEAWCEPYQSLPCEVAFTADDGAAGTSTAVRITSYINGLHPDQRELYAVIEQVLSRCIQPWNDCLVRGHHGAYDYYNHDQLGRVSVRILTFGVQWINELPSWATSFRVPSESQPGPEFALPSVESDLWQRALEYLKRPGCIDPDGWLADWSPGDDRTWDLLHEKAQRLDKFKHPEPGTSFSYDDWKTGRHESRAIVDRVPIRRPYVELRAADEWLEMRNAHLLEYPLSSLPLQDSWRAEGLQVFVEISSIELTPASPAYAPHAGAREAAYAARAARWLAKGLARNQPVSQDEDCDYDGWRLAGRLNEHVAAVAVFVFDADNVTAPRIGFRQKLDIDRRQYRFRGSGSDSGHDSDGGNSGYDSDDPVDANVLRKDYIGTLNEIFARPCLEMFENGINPCPHQHMGSVSLLSPQSAADESAQGRLVAFPNVVEHRIQPFRLADAARPGRLRWLTLHLVDPHYRICSTRNVPPQQHSWWAVPAREALADKGLPAELIELIMRYTEEDWPMGMEEAWAHNEAFRREAKRVRQQDNC